MGCVESRIAKAEGTSLLLPVIPEEVFEIVKHMNPSKSLGPDGFIRGFFQHYWQVVGDDVFKLVKSFFHSRHIPKRLNRTHITLIPKVSSLPNMKATDLCVQCSV